MAYQHDVFVSYRRDRETRAWIDDHLLPLLTARLGMALGRPPSIFIDDQLEAGTTWPVQLGTALGRSRILIPLWSGNYLTSKWCVAELGHMLARERATGLRTPANPQGIIVPFIIHDGTDEDMPPEVRIIQRLSMQEMFNLRMARNSPRAEQLDAILAAHADDIAACIDGAPAWRADWAQAGARSFMRRLQRPAPAQRHLPRFTV